MSKQSITNKANIIRLETEKAKNTGARVAAVIDDINDTKIDSEEAESFFVKKEQFNEEILEIKDLVASGIVGILKTDDAKPLPEDIGKYELSDIGTYTNLIPIIAVGSGTPSNIPIVTESTYLNSVYWDGVNFTQLRSAVGASESKVNAIISITGLPIDSELPTQDWLQQTWVEPAGPENYVFFDLRNEVNSIKKAKNLNIISSTTGICYFVFIDKEDFSIAHSITVNVVANEKITVQSDFISEKPHYIGIKVTSTGTVKLNTNISNPNGRMINSSGVVQDAFYPYAYSIETTDVSQTLAGRVEALEANTNFSDFTYVHWIGIAGQSNAMGVGSIYEIINFPPYNDQPFDWEEAFSRVFIWNMKTNTFDNLQIGVNNIGFWDGYYKNADDEGNTTTPNTDVNFGPELGIALGWLSTHKFGELYIFKTVGNGKPISYFQKGQPYYDRCLNKKANAEAWLAARGKKANKLASVWVQGESDNDKTEAYYLNSLNTLYANLINDGFLDTKATKVITQIPTPLIPETGMYSEAVKNAKDTFIENDPFALEVVYPYNFNGDQVHLNATGQIKLGLACFNAIYKTDAITPDNLEGKENWTL